MTENPKIGAQYQTMLVVWAALLFSQILFLVVVFVSKPELFKFDFSKPLVNSENMIFVILFAALSLMTFLISFVLERKFLKQSVDEQNPGLVQSALIVACALCEASSIFGLVLAFAFGYQYFFAWIALGILGVLLHFPKRESLIAASYKS